MESIKLILDEKNINIFGEISFKNENEKLLFLKKIDIITKNEINLKYINQDLIEIILKIEFNVEIISKFKKLNWADFNKMFLNDDKSSRKEKIYNNFLTFIQAELGLLRTEKEIFEKPLIETNDYKKDNKTTDNIKIDNNQINNTQEKKINDKNSSKFHLNLYKPHSDFNIEEDLAEKIKKYDIEVLFDYIDKPKKITVNDFTLYFNRRLQYFTTLLQNRVNLENHMRINQLKDFYGTNTEVSVIGLVSNISNTAKGHYMIDVEDKSGTIKCFVNKDNKEIIKIIKTLCLDEGIGIHGKVGDKIIWTDEIVIPSPPNENELKRTDKEEYVVMISDIHFGAKVFVDEAFQKFLDWISGQSNNEKLNAIAKKVKHILIPGDIIEGIGIYPGQGQDARILSSELQYHEATRWLDQIPKDKSIIIIPGNHDTDRLSEPQPKLPYDKAYSLYNMENVIMLSNPSRVLLFPNDASGGQEYYLYHGGSLFYYADKIQYLRDAGGARKPEEVVKYLLEKRHLAPSHGATLYIPDNQTDPLVIKKMPDFFLVGHTHKMAITNYKGCTITSCGCWVEMSDYQEKMGMYPDIGKAILINTRTRKPQIINFYTEKYKK